MRHVTIFAITALLCASALHAGERQNMTQPHKTEKPSYRVLEEGTMGRASLGGERAGRTEPSMEVTGDAAIYELLWRQFVRPETPPKVDFKKETVIFLLDPMRATGGFSITVRNVDLTTDPVRIVAERTMPEKDSMTTQVITAPFAVIAVPTRTLQGADWTDRDVSIARWRREPAKTR